MGAGSLGQTLRPGNRSAAAITVNGHGLAPLETWLRGSIAYARMPDLFATPDGGFPPFSWMLVAPGVWIALVLAVAMAFVLRRTVFGRRVFALGSSEPAARACGIPIERLKLQVYGIAGLLFGLAGVMQMSRLRQGDPTVAAGTELDVIAAVVIGGGSLSGGEGTILGSMIGALVMAFLRNGSQQMGWPSYVQEILIGVIIVVAVAIDRWRHAQQGESE